MPTTIPLFPLGIVLFPGMPLPLHIFEDRYKAMLQEVQADEIPFGVVYYDGENFPNVGCTAQLAKILKQHKDGRLDILCEGQRRFKIISLVDDKPYSQAVIEYFDDNVVKDLQKLEALASQGLELFREILELMEKDLDLPRVEKLDSAVISFLISSSGGFTMKEKQAFLEMVDTEERLSKSMKALTRMIERHKSTKEIERIIKGNGFVKK